MKWFFVCILFCSLSLFGDEPFSQEAYLKEMEELLSSEGRVVLVGDWGPFPGGFEKISSKELQKYCQEHDERVFDVIFVRMEGNFHHMMRTLGYVRGLAHTESLLVATWEEGAAVPMYAWERFLEKGFLEECASFRDEKGFVFKEGRFAF